MKTNLLLTLVAISSFCNAQIVNIPDTVFKNYLIAQNYDTNGNDVIEQSEIANISSLVLPNGIFDLTGIQSFTSLTTLTVGTGIININVSGMNSLTELACSNNISLTNINVNGCVNLTSLYATSCSLTNIIFGGQRNFSRLAVENNQLSSLDLSDCYTTIGYSSSGNLRHYTLENNPITFINLKNGIHEYIFLHQDTSTRFPGLTFTACVDPSELQYSSSPYYAKVYGANTYSTSCTGPTEPPYIYLATGSPNDFLNYLRCIGLDSNDDTVIQVSEAANLTSIDLTNSSSPCYTNGAQSSWTGINQFPNLASISLYQCGGSLNLNGMQSITSVSINRGSTGLVVTNTNLHYLNLYRTSIGTLNLTGVHALNYLNLYDCGGSTIDLSENYNAINPQYTVGAMTSMNLKNGVINETINYYPPAGPSPQSLRNICADDAQVPALSNQFSAANGYVNCTISSYCTFNPGGNYYTVNGNSKFDFNNNGCDISDIDFRRIKLSLNNGTNNLIIDSASNFNFGLEAGTHTITPVLENPSYFTVSPASSTVTFPTTASPFTQNFCITANGVHNDLETNIYPLTDARPNMNAVYKIVYKNKGNQTQSGVVSFNYNSALSTYVSSYPTFSSQSTNNLSYNFTNLLPFESRSITVTLLLNSPFSTPPLSGGEILNYQTTITDSNDETPADNIATLNQRVVNSHDPNDITCLEGNSISSSLVGEYVHYIIRFENTGTANALNVVVKDFINLTKYDISSLIPLDASHPFTTRIINDNQVEFIFKDINLPFSINNKGFIAFKIKTKSTLTPGDSFNNSANIYFDYNMPINTNIYTTTIQTLGNANFELTDKILCYPNPAHTIVTIETNNEIIDSLQVTDLLGKVVLTKENIAENKTNLDVSTLVKGLYFVKIETTSGLKGTKKLVVE